MTHDWVIRLFCFSLCSVSWSLSLSVSCRLLSCFLPVLNLSFWNLSLPPSPLDKCSFLFPLALPQFPHAWLDLSLKRLRCTFDGRAWLSSSVCISVKRAWVRNWCEHVLKVKPPWIRNLFIHFSNSLEAVRRWKPISCSDRFPTLESVFSAPSLPEGLFGTASRGLVLPVLLLRYYSWCNEIRGIRWLGSLVFILKRKRMTGSLFGGRTFAFSWFLLLENVCKT